MLTLRHAAASHQGLVRDGNEDAHHSGAHLLAVADGVGGMAAGDRASQMVIETLAGLDSPRPLAELESALREAVERANKRIADELIADPSVGSAGTTLTVLLLAEAAASDGDGDGENILLAHVGDSRCYRLRGERFEQLTKDDTFVQMLVDSGAISVEQAHEHPQRSIVTRVLRGEPVEVFYAHLRAEAGDRYLLCSDGLPAVVPEPDIAETLAAEPELERCVDRLVECALAGGGPDNVTVVVADCRELG